MEVSYQVRSHVFSDKGRLLLRSPVCTRGPRATHTPANGRMASDMAWASSNAVAGCTAATGQVVARDAMACAAAPAVRPSTPGRGRPTTTMATARRSTSTEVTVHLQCKP